MKKASRFTIASAGLLVLLALLTILVVKHRHLTPEEAAAGAVRATVKAGITVLKDDKAVGAVLVLVALFVFVIWTVLRAGEGEDKPVPPAGGSGAGGTREFR
jgi:hypothetical protein